jgi:hypothetical protein
MTIKILIFIEIYWLIILFKLTSGILKCGIMAPFASRNLERIRSCGDVAANAFGYKNSLRSGVFPATVTMA